MSLLLESEAQFRSRATEIGLSQETIQAIKDAGASTSSALAFAVGQPGTPIVSQEVDNFLRAALGRDPTLAENNGVRRLAFEAQTLLVASLRQVVEHRDDGAPKRIGAAERETRMNAIRAELGGLCIADEYEPSHLLLEKACQVHESNTLKYIDPASCTSRCQEVQGSTKTKELAFEGGALVIKDKEDKLIAPTSSEIQFLQAMTRRGIAFKFAKLMTYEQHTTWLNFLMQAMQREAPPGYSRPSLHQAMMCDKAAFTRLGSSMGSVRQLPDGSYPLGLRLLELRSDPSIALYLAPLARSQSSQGQGPRASPYNAAPRPGNAANQERKGKGKGKKGKSPPMPAELRNKWHRTSSGDPLCFGYNTSKGCDQAKDGEKCAKRWHLCAEPRCLQAHPLPQHPRKAS